MLHEVYVYCVGCSTQPPILYAKPEREMSTGQSAVMLCGWGVKAG